MLNLLEKLRFFRAAWLLAGFSASIGISTGAWADVLPLQGVVNLVASASVEVTKDLLTVALNTTREGPDASVVQSQLKLALDTALVEARKAARPGQVDVQTGNFSISPRYTNKGVTNGWQGSTELVIEGRDMQAIGQLTGRITSLTIARVGYNVSRELRATSESEVSAQAIAHYRSKAADYARQFGYSGYAVREVSISTNEPPPGRPMQMMAAKSMASSTEDVLPVEAGKAVVTVNVSGSVQLTR